MNGWQPNDPRDPRDPRGPSGPEDPTLEEGGGGDAIEERVPRRVRHLVVLPGGGGLDDLFSADSEAGSESGSESGGREAVAPTEVAERRGFRTFVPTKAVLEPVTAGALATQAVAEALPDAVPSSHNLKFKLRVITRSVTSPKAPGLPFIVFASILVSLAVLGMVFLRVMVDQASFKVDEVGTQVTQQQAQLTQLRYAVSVQEAPDHIAQRASQLGLVPAAKVQPLTPQTPTSTASGRANGA